MTLAITPLYAGLLALLLVGLSVHVIMARIAIMKGGNEGAPNLTAEEVLKKRNRMQGNFVEYAPMGLVLLLAMELQGAPGWAVHVLGLMLLAGRVAHAFGMGATPQILPLRQVGIVLTFLMLVLTGLGLIAHALL